MLKNIYRILNVIFYFNEGFHIIENYNKWININYKNEDFIVIYFNKKDGDIVIYYYYDYNSLEFINNYNIKKYNKHHEYIKIKNDLKFLYERKMIQIKKEVDHLNLFVKWSFLQ